LKRDLDLIRNIMLTLEDKLDYGETLDNNKLLVFINSDSLSIEKLNYHLDLLLETELIIATKHSYQGDPSEFDINSITNQGHDFLDTIREIATWDAIKAKAIQVGGFTLPILFEIGKDYLKKQAGL